MARDKFDLPRVAANYEPLSPLSFIRRTADVFPDRVAIVHGPHRATWAETYSPLPPHGLGPGGSTGVGAGRHGGDHGAEHPRDGGGAFRRPDGRAPCCARSTCGWTRRRWPSS